MCQQGYKCIQKLNFFPASLSLKLCKKLHSWLEGGGLALQPISYSRWIRIFTFPATNQPNNMNIQFEIMTFSTQELWPQNTKKYQGRNNGSKHFQPKALPLPWYSIFRSFVSLTILTKPRSQTRIWFQWHIIFDAKLHFIPLTDFGDLECWAQCVHSRVWKRIQCTHSVRQVNTARLNPSWYYPCQNNFTLWKLLNEQWNSVVGYWTQMKREFIFIKYENDD